MTRVQIVGGGRMGEAIVAGLITSGWATPPELRVVEASADRRRFLADHIEGLEVAEAPGPADGSVLAVKPNDIAAVAAQVSAAGGGRLLSIAAGVTIAAIETAVGAGVPVVRAMPNTAALVAAGASAISGGTAAGEDDLAWAEAMLGSVGVVVRVPESQLDAVTALSGSGPAYVFLVAESLIEAGVLTGLPRDVATTLAQQTLLGAARMLIETGTDAAALRAAVTSPGGTTAAALRVLEERAVRGAILDAVVAAKTRAGELS